MLINIDGNIVCELNNIIAFGKVANNRIAFYLHGLSNRTEKLIAVYETTQNRDVAFQKLEELLKVTNL